MHFTGQLSAAKSAEYLPILHGRSFSVKPTGGFQPDEMADLGQIEYYGCAKEIGVGARVMPDETRVNSLANEQAKNKAATAHTCGASIQKQQQFAPLFPRTLLLKTHRGVYLCARVSSSLPCWSALLDSLRSPQPNQPLFIPLTRLAAAFLFTR